MNDRRHIYRAAIRRAKERIPGGLAKGKKPYDFDPDALAKGVKVEMEHTTDPAIAQEIAMDHLTEDPDYYDKLEKIEKAAGILEPPPAMLKATKDWMFSVYAGHVLYYVERELATAGDPTEAIQKAIEAINKFTSTAEEKVKALEADGEFIRFSMPPVPEFRPFLMAIKVRAPVYGRDFYQYQFGRGERSISYLGWDDLSEALARLQRLATHQIDRLKAALEYAEKDKEPRLRDAEIVELNVLKRECLKYTTKAKAYATKTSEMFPVDLTGWKYIQPNSPVVQEYNKKVNENNESIQQGIAEAEKELAEAQVYYDRRVQEGTAHNWTSDAEKEWNQKGFKFWTFSKIQDALTQGKRPSETSGMFRLLHIPETGDFYSFGFGTTMLMPVEAARRRVLPTIGPNDVNEAVRIMWRPEIKATLLFVSHKTRGGQWDGREIQIDVGPSKEVRNVASFNRMQGLIEDSLRHEIQHVGQTALGAVFQSKREVTGLPPLKVREKGMTPGGFPTKRERGTVKRLEHPLRDIEFYTDLADATKAFMRDVTHLSPKVVPAYFRRFIGLFGEGSLEGFEPHDYFSAWKSKSPAKWQKAVKEMAKTLEAKGYHVNPTTTPRLAAISPCRYDFDRPERCPVAPDVMQTLKVELLGQVDNFNVWTVHGHAVRDTLDVNFTDGGNPARYGYIPSDEIWLENLECPRDLTATLFHELVETFLMQFMDISYEDAHEYAAQVEDQFRQSPIYVDDKGLCITIATTWYKAWAGAYMKARMAGYRIPSRRKIMTPAGRVASRYLEAKRLQDWLQWIVQPLKVIWKHHAEFVQGPIDDVVDEIIKELAPVLVKSIGREEVNSYVTAFTDGAVQGRQDSRDGTPSGEGKGAFHEGYQWGFANPDAFVGRALPPEVYRRVIQQGIESFRHHVTEEVVIRLLKKAWHAISPINTVKAIIDAVKKHGWKLGVGAALIELFEHFALPSVIVYLTGDEKFLALGTIPISEIGYAVVLRVLGRVPEEVDKADPAGHLEWYEANVGPVRFASRVKQATDTFKGEFPTAKSVLAQLEPHEAYRIICLTCGGISTVRCMSKDWSIYHVHSCYDCDEAANTFTKEEISASKVAARYKNKKKVKNKDGEEMVVYEYSDRQVQHRNREKAKRVEKLRGNLKDLLKQVKKDLKSEDTKTRMTALAVGLINDTYERVGNEGSAEDGHYGVTVWQKSHVTFGKGKATFRYVGKSGVKQEKETKDADLIRVLKEAVEDKGKDDSIFETDEVKIDSRVVNEYLKEFDITAKDIRGLHANRIMQEKLRGIRSKGGKLPEEKKDREKKLKDEFKEALDQAADEVGHEANTLKNQYLVPGLEDAFLKDGTVKDNLAKQKTGTKTPTEKEDEQVEDLIRPDPKNKPPRHDLRDEAIRDDDEDVEAEGADKDRDLSLNYKRIARVAARWFNRTSGKKPGPEDAKPGDYWKTEKGFKVRLKSEDGKEYDTFVESEEEAKAKVGEGEPEEEEGAPEKGVPEKVKRKPLSPDLYESMRKDDRDIVKKFWDKKTPEETDEIKAAEPKLSGGLKNTVESLTKLPKGLKLKKNDKALVSAIRNDIEKALESNDLAAMYVVWDRVSDSLDFVGGDSPANDYFSDLGEKLVKVMGKSVALEEDKAEKKPEEKPPEETKEPEEVRPEDILPEKEKEPEEVRPEDILPEEEKEPEGVREMSDAIKELETADLLDKNSLRGLVSPADEDKEEVAKAFEDSLSEESMPGSLTTKDLVNTLNRQLDSVSDLSPKSIRAVVKSIESELKYEKAPEDQIKRITKGVRDQMDGLRTQFEDKRKPLLDSFRNHSEGLKRDLAGKDKGRVLDSVSSSFGASFEGKSQEEKGRLLAEKLIAVKVVANPAVLGGKALSGTSKDEADLTKRAKESLAHFSGISPALRKEAYKQAVQQLSKVSEGSPERAELNRIVDGMILASIISDEDIPDVIKGTRPEPSPSFKAMAKVMHDQGRAERLLEMSGDLNTPENRDELRESIDGMDDEELASLFDKDDPWSGLAESLLESDEEGENADRKAWLRSFLRRMAINDMTVKQNVLNTVTKGEKPAERSKSIKELRGKMNAAAKENPDIKDLEMHYNELCAEGSEGLECKDLADRIEIADLALFLETLKKEKKDDLPENEAVVLQIQKVVETQDLDELNKVEWRNAKGRRSEKKASKFPG